MYGRTSDGVAREPTSLSNYCLSITDGDHQAPPRAERGIPFITISAINDGRVDLAKATRFVPAEYLEGLKTTRKAQAGDVLYSVTGSFGIPELVRDEEPFVFQRHIALLRPDPLKCDAHWLTYVMAAPQIFKQARAIATGTAQLTVPLSGLRVIQLPRMDLSEQRKISTKLDDVFARADRLEAEAARARALLDRLEAAILTKAFKGELVPQDPNDEPASALLERIKATRSQQAQSQPKRGRKASVPKAPREKAVMTKSRQDEDVKNMPYLASIIRQAGGSSKVEDLFKKADLPVTDFYKQLAWEVDQGHIRDRNNQTLRVA